MLPEKQQPGEDKGKAPQNTPPPDLNDQRADKELVIAAHKQADRDIDKDPDLSLHSPNDDLDEGETARLGDDKNDLV